VFLAALEARLDALMPENGILSLDVFDKFLVRDNSSELTRFVEIGTRMVAHAGGVAPIDAFLARYLGTKASYRAGSRVNSCGEGSLTEIHRVASRLVGYEEGLAGAFVEIELDRETERLSVNAPLLGYIRRHRDRGGKVIGK
jgi:hypothetical protein